MFSEKVVLLGPLEVVLLHVGPQERIHVIQIVTIFHQGGLADPFYEAPMIF